MWRTWRGVNDSNYNTGHLQNLGLWQCVTVPFTYVLLLINETRKTQGWAVKHCQRAESKVFGVDLWIRMKKNAVDGQPCLFGNDSVYAHWQVTERKFQFSYVFLWYFLLFTSLLKYCYTYYDSMQDVRIFLLLIWLRRTAQSHGSSLSQIHGHLWGLSNRLVAAKYPSSRVSYC